MEDCNSLRVPQCTETNERPASVLYSAATEGNAFMLNGENRLPFKEFDLPFPSFTELVPHKYSHTPNIYTDVQAF